MSHRDKFTNARQLKEDDENGNKDGDHTLLVVVVVGAVRVPGVREAPNPLKRQEAEF